MKNRTKVIFNTLIDIEAKLYIVINRYYNYSKDEAKP